MLPIIVMTSIANSVPGAYFARESSRVRCGVIVGAGRPGIGDEPGADRVAEVDDAAAAARLRGSVDAAAAAVRLFDDPQPAQLDLVDEGEAEVLHEQQRAIVASSMSARRQVEAEPGAGQLTAVGEADVEVEVGAVVGHAMRSLGRPDAATPADRRRIGSFPDGRQDPSALRAQDGRTNR